MNEIIEKDEFVNTNSKANLKLPDLKHVISRHTNGDIEYAEKSYQALIDANYPGAIVYSNLATIYNQKREHEKAIVLLERAIQVEPDYANAYLILGSTIELHRNENLDQAINYYFQALDLKPDHPKILSILGNALHKRGQILPAIECFEKVVLSQPDDYIAHYNLGTLLMLENRLDEASSSFQNALNINEHLGGALSKLWYLRMRMSDWSDYSDQLPDLKDSIYKILEHTELPDTTNTVTPFPLLGVFDDPELLHTTAKQYVRAITTEVTTTEPLYKDRKRKPGDIIKIAFLATDYHNHPTTFLVAELFELLDPELFEIHVISHNRVDEHSEIRERIKSISKYYYDVTDRTDEVVAHFIAQLEIDIAVDLKGLTEGCRPGILAHRPAPVQVRLLGFPGTTGTDSIDYFIADPVIIPEEEQANYSENIMYMPDSYQINDRKREVHPDVPTREACGLPENAFVYCTFNHNFKIMPEVFDIWMELLKETPNSVLWLLESNKWAGENLLNEAKARGVDTSRIIFAEMLPSAKHLARIQNADLFLDTFPCNAHTTASDALWVGLPVLTCMGRSMAARVAASILKAVDLEELITTDFESYKALALELAHNPERLDQIKLKLKENRDTCSLFDTETYTKNLQRGFIHMLDLHESGSQAESFYVSNLEENHHDSEVDPTPENNSLIVNIAIISPQDHVHSEAYYEISETLSHSFNELGFITNIAENTLIDDGINIIIGAHLLEDSDIELLPNSSIIYNLEYVTKDSEWFTPALLDLFNTFEVWDSSKKNINALNNKGVSKKIYFVPCKNTKTQNVAEYINEALMALGNNVTEEPQPALTNDSYLTGLSGTINKVTATAVVCVPIYNEERYIKDTLDSLHRVPEGLDVKFFVVDNKSTDRSFEIVKSFAAKDDRFVIHQHEKNLGAAENFYYVYNNSDSPYVMWLGGHDQIDPEYIKKAIDTFDKHEDAAYVAAEPSRFIDDIENAVLMEDAKYDFSEQRLTRYMQSVTSLANCTIVNSMFRREFLKDLEFRTTRGNDHVLISHLLWHGKIYYTESGKYYRRFFNEERGSQEERITGDKTKKLDHHSLIQYYIDDFKNLYSQPGDIQDYLCQKMLMILEGRFGLECFDKTQ